MIRKAKQTELSSVMQIWLEGNIEAHPFIPAEYWQKNAEHVRKMMMASEIYVYENEEEQKLVGFIGLIDNFIGGLFVHTAYRTSGVGKELLQFVKLVKPFLTLHVYKRNSYALAFYEREGFKISKEQMDTNTGEAEYIMTWEK